MRGLWRNNFYATFSNAKAFLIIMLIFGVFVIIMEHEIPSLVISGYMLLGIIGFSLNSLASLRKESIGKWSEYKLTTPVKRSDIVKSYFFNLLLWLFVGMVFAGIGAALSITLHGYPFSKNTDIFMLFVIGTVCSLFMGAIFFPLFCLGDGERNEVYIMISVLCVIGIIIFLDSLFPDSMNTVQIILGAILILVCVLIVFVLSYLLTVVIYHKNSAK